MISESVKVKRILRYICRRETTTDYLQYVDRGVFSQTPSHFHTYRDNIMPFNDLTGVKACVKVGVKVKVPCYTFTLLPFFRDNYQIIGDQTK